MGDKVSFEMIVTFELGLLTSLKSNATKASSAPPIAASAFLQVKNNTPNINPQLYNHILASKIKDSMSNF